MVEHLLRAKEKSHQFCIGNESRQSFHHRRRIKHARKCYFWYQRPDGGENIQSSSTVYCDNRGELKHTYLYEYDKYKSNLYTTGFTKTLLKAHT